MVGVRAYMEADPAVAFAPGELIAGRYRVERVIGQGGMGIVVAVQHVQLEQRFAIKFLIGHGVGESVQVARFFREARAAAQVKSEHVTRVVDTGTLETGEPYIVMECLDGHDLESELAAKGPLPVAEAIDYVLQACEAIAEAHALGIVHRDLKPANLFLARRGDGSICVKVLDFGISKVVTAATPEPALTATHSVMGSPMYMSPEQIRSSKSVDARTDIWSLGVILFELLSGQTPFAAETLSAMLARIIADPPTQLSALKPELPKELEATIMACLEKDPNHRPPSLMALTEALLPFAPPSARISVERVLRLGAKHGDSATPLAAKQGTGLQTDAAWGQTNQVQPARSHKLAAGVAAAAVLVVLIASGAWLWQANASRQAAASASSKASVEAPATIPTPAVTTPPQPEVAASVVAAPIPEPHASASSAPARIVGANKPRTSSGTKPVSAPPARPAVAAAPAPAPKTTATTKPFGGRL